MMNHRATDFKVTNGYTAVKSRIPVERTLIELTGKSSLHSVNHSKVTIMYRCRITVPGVARGSMNEVLTALAIRMFGQALDEVSQLNRPS